MAKMCDSWVVPGAMVVNTLPILRHTPSWFPGAAFKKYAIEGQKLTRQIRDVPFGFTVNSIVRKLRRLSCLNERLKFFFCQESGTANPSIVAELLANGEDRETIKEVAATGYGGLLPEPTVSHFRTYIKISLKLELILYVKFMLYFLCSLVFTISRRACLLWLRSSTVWYFIPKLKRKLRAKSTESLGKIDFLLSTIVTLYHMLEHYSLKSCVGGQ